MGTTTATATPTAKINTNKPTIMLHGLMEPLIRIIREETIGTLRDIYNGLTPTPNNTPILSHDGLGGM